MIDKKKKILFEFLAWIVLLNKITCQSIEASNSIELLSKESLNMKKSENFLSAVSHVNYTRLLNHNEWNQYLCGGTFRDRQVLIKSPNYPNKYPKNVHCEYNFYSPFVCTTEFHIQFLDFQLEPSVECSKDSVTIGTQMQRIQNLCGQVIGIMKYTVLNGMLRINFTSDAINESKGFQLLVTRLPCSQTDSNDGADKKPIETVSISYGKKLSDDDQPIAKSQPIEIISNSVVPITPKPVCSSQSVANGNWMNNNIPQSMPLPNCCLNAFNQQQFSLISQGFPNSANFYYTDCLYYIERSHPNICRLRIEFKYLNLGASSRQYNRCSESFLEIDGHRFCGCKTGFVYFTQYGYQPKTIRYFSIPFYQGIQGFVLNIVQEECPRRRLELPVTHLPSQSYLSTPSDPKRCSYNYIDWLMRTSYGLSPQSICMRNYY